MLFAIEINVKKCSNKMPEIIGPEQELESSTVPILPKIEGYIFL
jgi:hypothetical protein